MTPELVAECVGEYVGLVCKTASTQAREEWLRRPDTFWHAHAADFEQCATASGLTLLEIADYVRNAPYLHLKAVFPCADLPETPVVWMPVPPLEGPVRAQLAMLLVAGASAMEPVSYGSENDGAPFVNLVTLPGQGLIVEKSKAAMRGHTDAASFPFRGTTDPQDPRIAPSPDLVFLGALRNPDQVPTLLMPLDQIVAHLDPHHLEVLKGPNIVLNAQRTFQRGTKQILGYEHLLDGAPVLMDTDAGLVVRYTHSQSTVFDESDQAVVVAKEAFEDACAKCVESLCLQPGDILVVNNRKALHGRAPVGSAVGGQSRWLIRSYALDCKGLEEERRYASPRYKLFP